MAALQNFFWGGPSSPPSKNRSLNGFISARWLAPVPNHREAPARVGKFSGGQQSRLLCHFVEGLCAVHRLLFEPFRSVHPLNPCCTDDLIAIRVDGCFGARAAGHQTNRLVRQERIVLCRDNEDYTVRRKGNRLQELRDVAEVHARAGEADTVARPWASLEDTGARSKNPM